MAVIEGANQKSIKYLHVVILKDISSHFLFIILLCLVVVFSIVVIRNVQTTRKSVVSLNREYNLHDKLDRDFTHLQLEQQTLAEHSRIEDLAEKKLQMHVLKPEQEIFINNSSSK